MNNNIFFPEFCPHCGHENQKNKWCYETIGEGGTIYGFCNREAEPATGWTATSDKDKNGITKYVYEETIVKTPFIGKAKTTYYTYDKLSKPFVRVKRTDSKDGKSITQEKYIEGQWVSGGFAPEEVPLYRYPELDYTQPLFIVEGEKVADRLWELGLQATTNIGGSKKWREAHTESLKKFHTIIICPDRDKVGIEHAETLYGQLPNANWLYAFPNSPYWRLNVPANKGVDLCDYLDKTQFSAKELIAEIKKQPIHHIKTDIEIKNITPLEELVGFIRDKFKTLGNLEQADLFEIAQKTKLPHQVVEKLYKEELDKLTVAETLPNTDIAKLFEYQSKQICLSDLISDQKLCVAFKSYCEVNRVDEVLLVMSLLPLLGGQLGTKIKIAPKSTWFEYPVFWSVTVAPPSSKKSVVQNHLYKVAKKNDADNERRDRENREALKKVQKAWDKMNQNQQEAQENNVHVNPDLYEKEFCSPPRLAILQSCSSESLWKRISEQPDDAGVVWCWDEIAGLLEGLDKYSKGSETRPLLLSTWSNHMNYLSVQRVDRANSFRLAEQSLSITGNIQPDLFSKHFRINGDNDGFVSRWLYAIPKKHPLFTKYTNRSVELQEIFEELTPKIMELPPTIITFSTSAHAFWVQVHEKYYLEIEKVLYSNPTFAQYISKMLSYVLRFCVVIHTLDVISGISSDISICTKSALERAVKMGSYFLGQFRLLQMSDKTTDKEEILKSFNLDKILLDIMEYLKAVPNGSKTATVRDLTRKLSGQYLNNVKVNTDIVNELLSHLADLSFGYFSGDPKSFTLTTPSIEKINQAVKPDEPLQPLSVKFTANEIVCILGGGYDGYLVCLDQATPLTVTFSDPLTGESVTIPTDFVESYTDEIADECALIADKLKKVTNKEETLRVIYSHSRYFRVTLKSILDDDTKIFIEQFID